MENFALFATATVRINPPFLSPSQYRPAHPLHPRLPFPPPKQTNNNNKSSFSKPKLAGNIVHLPASELNAFAAQYLAVRLVYSVLYIRTPARNILLSYVRSGLWTLGCGLCVRMLVRASAGLI
jgi:hypothetical protein